VPQTQPCHAFGISMTCRIITTPFVYLIALLVSPFGASTAAGQTTDFTFADPVVIEFPNDQFPSHVAGGDLDGDGNIDLVVTGRNSDGIVYVLPGNGDGSFAPPQSLTVESQTDHAVLADFDGNGTLDLALSFRSQTGRIAILPGNGDGTFADVAEVYLVGRQPQAMVGDDFNGDGHVDLAVANYNSGTVRLLLNDGDGTFTMNDPVVLEEYVVGLTLPHRITTGDLTGNGAPDIAVTSLGTGRFSILINDGSGNFTTDRTYRLPQITDGQSSATVAAIADFTGNGQIDVCSTMSVGSSQQDMIAVFETDAPPALDPPQTFNANTFGLLFSMMPADFDGDGLLDVVVGTGLSTQLAFLRNVSSDGVVDFLDPMVISASVGFALTLQPMDVNNDGAIDLVYPNISHHRLHILLNETPQAGSASEHPTGMPGDRTTRPGPSNRGRPTEQSDVAAESFESLRKMLGITDQDTPAEVLRKLESIGDELGRTSR